MFGSDVLESPQCLFFLEIPALAQSRDFFISYLSDEKEEIKMKALNNYETLSSRACEPKP